MARIPKDGRRFGDFDEKPESDFTTCAKPARAITRGCAWHRACTQAVCHDEREIERRASVARSDPLGRFGLLRRRSGGDWRTAGAVGDRAAAHVLVELQG